MLAVLVLMIHYLPHVCVINRYRLIFRLYVSLIEINGIVFRNLECIYNL